MEDFLVLLQTYVLPHWPFFAFTVLSIVLGQMFKNAVWTKKRAHAGKPRWFWLWARRTISAHPVLIGVIVGMGWQTPEAGVSGLVPAVLYFSMAGAMSTWAFNVLRGLGKKYGVDVDLPGNDDERDADVDHDPDPSGLKAQVDE